MDFIYAILFLLWFEVLSLPLRWAIAGWRAPADVRRMLSRLAGPSLLVLPIWFAAHLGWGLLERYTGLIWITLAAAAGLLIGLRALRPGRPVRPIFSRLMAYECPPGAPATRAALKHIGLDLLMAALVLGFIAMRRWVPEMTNPQLDGSGAEKYANAMIFWTSWNARHLPPDDYWLSGTPLTYYYWGHFQWAWLARLAGFPVELALNLAFGVAATLVWVAGYLLARAMRLSPGWAAGAGIAVAWAGNPESIRQLTLSLQNLRVAPFHSPNSFGGWLTAIPAWLAGLGRMFVTVPFREWPYYDYWAPSRAIPNVVDEFPAFSAILGDFHSHHLALPWLTGWFALCIAGRRWVGAPKITLNSLINSFLWAAIWLTLALAGVLTNMWNLPLVGLGLAILLAATLLPILWHGRLARDWKPFILSLIFYALLTLVLGVALKIGMTLIRAGSPLPLPPAAGKGLLAKLPIRLLDPKLRSTVGQLFGLWGFPVILIALAAFLRTFDSKFQISNSKSERIWIPMSLVLGLLLILGSTGLPGGTAWVWVGVGLWIVSLTLGRHPWLSRPTAAALLAACVVLGGLEIAYMPDRFVGDYARYNAYFKFTYPAWPILWAGAFVAARRLCGFGSGVPALAGHSAFRVPHSALVWFLRAAFAILLVLSALYTVCAIPARLLLSFSGDGTDPPRRPTLNAYDFIVHRPPWDVEAPLLAYIRHSVPTGERIAETPGTAPYTYPGRVASLAGHPIPIGWAHHEQQWRGEPGYTLIESRMAAVNQFYRSPTPELMRQRARELGVSWAVFGRAETEAFGPRDAPAILATLRAAATLVFDNPETKPTVFLFHFDSIPSKMRLP